ncbi:hypothetical protein FBQ97_08365 [Acidobacteria bacterium ACD]|nr:MAG: hypothetical protein EDX89_02220 [Acidobacteriota bacterium]MCE7957843.1 hypothetical protein [Acidobacteria bacterium ACB2]MDL1949809.1 hypothetical protein [Acidobacteria bacterium ACD]
MTPRTLLALALIGLGVLGLVVGQLTYTKEDHKANVGPFSFSYKEKETVRVPTWLGAGAIVAGTVLLIAKKKG